MSAFRRFRSCRGRDDATNHIEARFYPAATLATHMDLLRVWLRRHGRPIALYTDRHSIFEAHDKGKALPNGVTQFGRALAELDIGLIRAHNPQAKGRVERSFGTAQDRWVKELRLATVTTCEGANEVLKLLLPEHNRRFGRAAQDRRDAHRALASGHRLEAILSEQEARVVSNDSVVRSRNRFYQLLKPAYPGERGGRVVIEERLDGTRAVRFRGHYLKYEEIPVEEQDPEPRRKSKPEAKKSTEFGTATPVGGSSVAEGIRQAASALREPRGLMGSRRAE